MLQKFTIRIGGNLEKVHWHATYRGLQKPKKIAVCLQAMGYTLGPEWL